MTLARRSGAHTPARAAACQTLLQRLRGGASQRGIGSSEGSSAGSKEGSSAGNGGVDTVRIAWADVHGNQRAKTLVVDNDAGALASALQEGVGMVSTLLLKDSSDRTAFKVFEPGALAALPGFGAANNTLLLPDPSSFIVLPWAQRTGWLRAQPLWPDGSPVMVDPRPVLQRALAALAALTTYTPAGAKDASAAPGLSLHCGLEVEFHIYRITAEGSSPHTAAWSAEAPDVALLHPGYALLNEAHADQAAAALDLVRHTLLGLGLPLQSLEIELGPSQFEVVLAPTDALTAADQMLLLRNGLRQALRRAGFYASFVCRPPFAGAVASGWHLHQSLLDGRGKPVFARSEAIPSRARAAAPIDAGDARAVLSDIGAQWLAGLLDHAPGTTALCAPTLPAYSRYRGSVMAPQSAVWGFDNRGAMLRVLGQDGAVRIENRLPEPLANPYLLMAAQIWAGLDGLQRGLHPGPSTDDPYAAHHNPLPATLAQALQALAADTTLQGGLGAPMTTVYQAMKHQELARHAEAEDPALWERREYFARY